MQDPCQSRCVLGWRCKGRAINFSLHSPLQGHPSWQNHAFENLFACYNRSKSLTSPFRDRMKRHRGRGTAALTSDQLAGPAAAPDWHFSPVGIANNHQRLSKDRCKAGRGPPRAALPMHSSNVVHLDARVLTCTLHHCLSN